MRLHLKCGVYEEERRLGVQVLLSLKVLSSEFVDYQELSELALKVASKNFKYLEDFQDALLKELLERWSPEEVVIETVKLSVPFQHSFDKVGVGLRWRRGR